jgi:hypothetical protein
MGSRTWIKIHCDKWVSGTLREDAPDVRGVWIDLLALAGSGQCGDTGEIKLTNGVGFTNKQISEILQIKPALWRRAKERFLQTERIKISSKGAICITNWSKYQSEYNRQKPYRQPKEDTSTLEPKSPFTNPLEKEKEIESKKLQPEVTTRSYNATPPLQDDTYNNFKSQGGKPPFGQTPLSNKNTLITKVVTYLEQGKVSSAGELSTALGITIQTVRVTLTSAKHKGLVTNVGRGLWAAVSLSVPSIHSKKKGVK